MTTANPYDWMKKAQDSIAAADLLASKGFYEIATSRAYYAMFYAAQALLATQGLSYSKHSAVIAAFGREFAKTGKLDPKLHRYLIGAQASRQTGDYAIDVHMPPEEANRIITWAKEFYTAAETYLQQLQP